MHGIHKRIGEEVKSDYTLSIAILHKILGKPDNRWMEAITPAKQKEVVEIAFLLVVTFCLGLRGEEVIKADIAVFMKYFEPEKTHP
jgi:hypothetical protein